MRYDFSTYRSSDIARKLAVAGFRPFDMMVTGATGAGKSTTLNALFKRTVATVGDGVDPETMELDAYSLSDVFRVWDTPGLGDGVAQDKVHQRKLEELLRKTYGMADGHYGFIDLALVVIDGSSRDLGTAYRLLNDVIVPNLEGSRIIVAVNQADFAMKGHHWLSEECTPDARLQEFLDEQALSIQRRVLEATGVAIARPVCYSAKWGYGMNTLFDRIVDQMPQRRRPCPRR